MNVKEIREKIEETSKWTPGSTKDISMQALGRMLLARMGQVEFKPGLYFERDELRIPSLLDRVFHLIGFHCWVKYDDSNVFDGTRQGCLICGYIESSMMRRDLAYYEDAREPGLDVKELHAFIRKVKPSEDET